MNQYLLSSPTRTAAGGIAPSSPRGRRSSGPACAGPSRARTRSWTVPYADADFGAFMSGCFAKADAFLLGRKTYEIFARHWPRVTDPDDPIAIPLNSLPKYVVSSTLTAPGWHDTTVLTGDLAGNVGRLTARPGNELQVHGSGELARALIAHGLVDELRLLIFPVILGVGSRLFPRRPVAAAMQLAGSITTSKGVTILTLRPSGPATFGSFALDP
jgi:dihydrofolate reductase